MESFRLLFTVCILIMFVIGVLLFEQSDYRATTERAIISASNKKYISVANVHFFKYNRTYTALNITLNIARDDIQGDVKADVQAYKFLSNEYRFFPLTFTMDVCDTLDKNLFGLKNFFFCGNFTGCPIRKGLFEICNWGPDYSKFPPHIPVGQYRIDLRFKHAKEDLFTFEWYIKVQSTRTY